MCKNEYKKSKIIKQVNAYFDMGVLVKKNKKKTVKKLKMRKNFFLISTKLFYSFNDSVQNCNVLLEVNASTQKVDANSRII